MLGLAKRIKAKILQASTSEIYGDPSVHPQTEGLLGQRQSNWDPLPVTTKVSAALTLFFDYWRQHRLRIKVARIFNTYGPRMHPNDGRVVSNFIVQALLGREITIYGDGTQTRSFCYVDDLVDGLVRLMGTGDDVTGPVNLGNPVEFSIFELASKVVTLTGSRSHIVHKPLPRTTRDSAGQTYLEPMSCCRGARKYALRKGWYQLSLISNRCCPIQIYAPR